MKKEIEAEIDKILYARRQAELDQNKRASESAERKKASQIKFDSIKEKIIKPAMVEIGERIKAGGIGYKIIEISEQDRTYVAEYTLAGIRIELKIGDETCFGIFCSTDHKLKYFFNCSGRDRLNDFQNNTLQEADITPDFIHSKTLILLKEATDRFGIH